MQRNKKLISKGSENSPICETSALTYKNTTTKLTTKNKNPRETTIFYT